MRRASSAYQDGRIPIVKEICLEDFPVGRSRALLEVSRDGLGRTVCLPLLILRGSKPGPTFGLTAALHGNELNGIPVIRRLLASLDGVPLRGTILAAPVLNIPGFLANQRRYRDGVDLNHIMPGDPRGNESEVYAHSIVERLIHHFDLMMDLHTASFGRINSLYVRADMSDPDTATMARLQRPQIILHNPPADHTLRGAAAELGIPAVTVEIGDPQVFQQKHIRPTLAGIRAVLSERKMIAGKKRVERPPAVLCSRSEWLFTSSGGLLEVQPELASIVETGDQVARQVDIFGDVIATYTAPQRGVVIGKAVNPVAPTGSRILHVGHIATDEERAALLGSHRYSDVPEAPE